MEQLDRQKMNVEKLWRKENIVNHGEDLSGYHLSNH